MCSGIRHYIDLHLFHESFAFEFRKVDEVLQELLLHALRNKFELPDIPRVLYGATLYIQRPAFCGGGLFAHRHTQCDQQRSAAVLPGSLALPKTSRLHTWNYIYSRYKDDREKRRLVGKFDPI